MDCATEQAAQTVEFENTLSELVDDLKCYNDPVNDPLDSVSSALYETLTDMAMQVAVNDWARAKKLLVENIIHMHSNTLPDGAIINLIDLALEDPQVQEFTQTIKSSKTQERFKSLSNDHYVKCFAPRTGAISLLMIAENFAHPASQYMSEVKNMRNMIDPDYHLSEQDQFVLH